VASPAANLLEALDDSDEGSYAVVSALLAGLPKYAVQVVLHELSYPSQPIRSRTAYAVGLLQKMARNDRQGRKLHTFEAGRLWERIKNDRTSWDEVVHGSNAEMVMRMCEVQEREFRAEPMDDEFVQVWVA
jgi:hypothetical protein